MKRVIVCRNKINTRQLELLEFLGYCIILSGNKGIYLPKRQK